MADSPAQRLGHAHQEALARGAEPVPLRAATLLHVARLLATSLDIGTRPLDPCRLAQLAADQELSIDVTEAATDLVAARMSPGGTASGLVAGHLMGEVLDLLQASERTRERRKTGSYFTPGPVARELIKRALSIPSLHARISRGGLSVCDPACGGGAFLLEAAHQLAERGLSRKDVAAHIFGVDLSEVALATTEIALWFFVGDGSAKVSDPDRFVCGDALVGQVWSEQLLDVGALAQAEPDVQQLDFWRAFPGVPRGGFDWIVGNPPWVAFQGRATQKITTERRAFYRTHFRAFAGYPTLHGLFIERATQLAPSGHLTLLVPSSVSDLDGYRSTRAALTVGHEPWGALPEYGQDAFEGVVQPCFGLIAAPRPAPSSETSTDHPWSLEERTHAEGDMKLLAVPEVFAQLARYSLLPRATFREMGFQSNRVVAASLFHRGDDPPKEFSVPLLEGRNVGEFQVRAPRLFLRPDEETLTRTKCRLKAKETYEEVDVVVRQTAAFTIAARHSGARFRNSLIGAFATPELSADLLIGLLNSVLYRGLHVARQRDARQAAFPQVKLAHLRRLPAPPMRPAERARIEMCSADAQAAGGLTAPGREKLDAAVFDLFEIGAADRLCIIDFVRERCPNALRPSVFGTRQPATAK